MKPLFICLFTMVPVVLYAQSPKVQPDSTHSFVTLDCLGDKPLYVVNGKIIPCDSVRFIKPNDIYECEILKGASASDLYGPAGSKNGTIVITTKEYASLEKEKSEQKQEEIKKP